MTQAGYSIRPVTETSEPDSAQAASLRAYREQLMDELREVERMLLEVRTGRRTAT